MFWRPTRFLIAIVPAAGLTALFVVYLRLDHNWPRFVEDTLAGFVLLGAWYGVAAWLMRAESLRMATDRIWLSLKVLAAGAVVLAGLGLSGVINDDPKALSDGLRCADCPSVSVSRIIDGDTLVISGGRRVRLFGIDAPEVGERCSGDATDELRRLAGSRVRTEDGPRSVDVYGRRLFYLYQENGDSIDAALIGDGLAVAWTRDGQHRDALVALEAEARESGTGCIW